MAGIVVDSNYRSISLIRPTDFDAISPRTYSEDGSFSDGIIVRFQANGVDLTSKKLFFQDIDTDETLYLTGNDLLTFFKITGEEKYYSPDGSPTDKKIQNGKTYRCWVEINPNIQGVDLNIKSNVQQLSCYENPSIVINIVDMHNGKGTIDFVYSQRNQQEKLYEYRCVVMRENIGDGDVPEYGAFLDTGWSYGYSSTVYGSSNDGVPTAIASMKYELSGLENGIRYKGIVLTRSKDQNGLLCSSYKTVQIVTKKETPSTDIELSKSETTDGAILVSADIKKIVGTYIDKESKDPTYILEHGVDLRKPETAVIFKENILYTLNILDQDDKNKEIGFVIDVQNPTIGEVICSFGVNGNLIDFHDSYPNSLDIIFKKKDYDVMYPEWTYDINTSSEIDPSDKNCFFERFSKLPYSKPVNSEYYFTAKINDETNTYINSNFIEIDDGIFESTKIRLTFISVKNPYGYILKAEKI